MNPLNGLVLGLGVFSAIAAVFSSGYALGLKSTVRSQERTIDRLSTNYDQVPVLVERVNGITDKVDRLTDDLAALGRSRAADDLQRRGH